MKFPRQSLLVLTALALSTLLPAANAQLNLSGSTYGSFLSTGQPHTTIVNGPVTSTFSSGVPYRFFDHQTSIDFTGSAFTGVQSGDTFSLGTVKFNNGITKLHSTAHVASMDLFLNVPAHGVSNFKLTTLFFGLDNTDNHGVQDISDLYYIGHTLPPTLKFADGLVFFNIGLTDPSYGTLPGHPIHENKSGMVGITAEVRLVPVPEASTYATFAALGLLGVIGLRRLRRSSPARA
jgi:hypothetical protein